MLHAATKGREFGTGKIQPDSDLVGSLRRTDLLDFVILLGLTIKQKDSNVLMLTWVIFERGTKQFQEDIRYRICILWLFQCCSSCNKAMQLTSCKSKEKKLFVLESFFQDSCAGKRPCPSYIAIRFNNNARSKWRFEYLHDIVLLNNIRPNYHTIITRFSVASACTCYETNASGDYILCTPIQSAWLISRWRGRCLLKSSLYEKVKHPQHYRFNTRFATKTAVRM